MTTNPKAPRIALDDPLERIPMRRPIAYLRKSRVTSDRHVSWEVQEAAIRDLSARNGDTDVEILSDWNKSGRGELTKRRLGYLELRKRIEGDQVSVLYAYSLSRLSRSLGEYASLAELCRDHGVRIRLVKEGEFDYGSASGRFTVGILALLAQMEAELAQERAKDTIAVRKARGDHVGSAGFGKRLENGKLEDDPAGDVDAVLAAWRTAGSYQRAARLLNGQSVATKTGSPWAGNTVRNIVRRSVPASELASRRIEPRVRSVSSFALSRLLRCPCGTLLTGRRAHKYGASGQMHSYIGYLCHRGRHVPDHPRPYMVAEAAILPWIRAEAERLRLPERVEVLHAAGDRRDELEAERAHVTRTALVPGVDLATVEARLAELDAELAGIDHEREVVAIPSIDWTAPPDQLNAVLRALWEVVELGPDMRPATAIWTVPEWRAA